VCFSLHDPTFSRFGRTPTYDRQTDRQTDRLGAITYRASRASRGKKILQSILVEAGGPDPRTMLTHPRHALVYEVECTAVERGQARDADVGVK